MEYNKKILSMAKEHEQLAQKLKVDAYVIPTAYVDADKGVRDKASQEVPARNSLMTLRCLHSFSH